MPKRWPAFTRFLDDGRICLSNNAAERALRGIALERRSWLFRRFRSRRRARRGEVYTDRYRETQRHRPGKTAPIKLLLLDSPHRRGTRRMFTSIRIGLCFELSLGGAFRPRPAAGARCRAASVAMQSGQMRDRGLQL